MAKIGATSDRARKSPRTPEQNRTTVARHRAREKERVAKLEAYGFQLAAIVHAVREQALRRADEFPFVILADDDKITEAIWAAITSGAWGIEQLPAGDAK